jgi:hypothetical protein
MILVEEVNSETDRFQDLTQFTLAYCTLSPGSVMHRKQFHNSKHVCVSGFKENYEIGAEKSISYFQVFLVKGFVVI